MREVQRSMLHLTGERKATDWEDGWGLFAFVCALVRLVGWESE